VISGSELGFIILGKRLSHMKPARKYNLTYEVCMQQSKVLVIASVFVSLLAFAGIRLALDSFKPVKEVSEVEIKSEVYNTPPPPVKEEPESITELTLWMMDQPRCKGSKATELSAAKKTMLAKQIDRIITNEGGERHIQEAFLFIVCKESQFRSSAKSPANAFGISQMILGTAQMEADRLSLGKLTAEDLYDTEISLTLGYRHFKALAEKYHGNIARASASYNGGSAGATVTSMLRGGGRGVHETDDYVASIFDMTEQRRIAKQLAKN